MKVCITGGAGAAKTTYAKYLPDLKRKSDKLGVKYIMIKSKDVDFISHRKGKK